MFKPKASSVIVNSFSLKYPPDSYFVDVESINTQHVSGLPMVLVTNYQVSSISELPNAKSCIKIYTTLGYSSVKDALNNIGGGTFDISNDPKVLSSEKIIISGIEGIKRKVVQVNEKDETFEASIIKNNETFYFRSCSKNDNNNFDKILPTFKFLD